MPMFASKVAELSSKPSDITHRIRDLSAWLKQDHAAHNITRFAAIHPPSIQFVKELASGQTGRVHEIAITGNQRNLAVKCIDWSTRDQRVSVAKRVATEVAVLTSIDHPLLPRLYQVYNAGNEFCMAMTLCSRGTVWHAIQEAGGHLPLDLVKRYIAELVVVFDVLHKHDVVYVDLKPENILIQDSGHIMLCDFDLAHTSAEILELAQAQAGGPATFWGTIEYSAPEIVQQGAGQYSPASDWWAVGVLVYEMLLGHPPFSGDSFEAMVDSISRAEIFLPDGPYQLDSVTESLVLHFLCPDPSTRLGSRGVEEVINHPFFSGIDFDALVREVAMERSASEP